jgi:hypothetical protein
VKRPIACDQLDRIFTMNVFFKPTSASTGLTALRFSGLCLSAALLSTSAMAANGAAASDVDAKYREDRAKCLMGQTNQDQPTCLREAGAARDAAKKGQLNDGDAKYRKNSKERCKELTGDEAADCKARMNGKGTVSGSVGEGGVLRETVTREIGPIQVIEPAASAAN